MKYRKKPVVIEAKKWVEGRIGADDAEFFGWMTQDCNFDDSDGLVNSLQIETLEGSMSVMDGDYIIKGVQGEFYPCKPDIFEMTHEAVE